MNGIFCKQALAGLNSAGKAFMPGGYRKETSLPISYDTSEVLKRIQI